MAKGARCKTVILTQKLSSHFPIPLCHPVIWAMNGQEVRSLLFFDCNGEERIYLKWSPATDGKTMDDMIDF